MFGVGLGEIMDFSDRFEYLLNRYRKSDGTKWSGAEIDRETGGAVTASYVTSLRKGRVRKPGLDKLRAIARVLGFPWQEWIEAGEEHLANPPVSKPRAAGFSDLLNYLFDEVENYRTGQRFTDREVAALSGGALLTREVTAMREGEVSDPTMAQLLALSDVFGVAPSYWFSSPQTLPVLSEETLKALTDQNAQLVLQKSYGISNRDRDMILSLLDRIAQRNKDL